MNNLTEKSKNSCHVFLTGRANFSLLNLINDRHVFSNIPKWTQCSDMTRKYKLHYSKVRWDILRTSHGSNTNCIVADYITHRTLSRQGFGLFWSMLWSQQSSSREKSLCTKQAFVHRIKCETKTEYELEEGMPSHRKWYSTTDNLKNSHLLKFVKGRLE